MKLPSTKRPLGDQLLSEEELRELDAGICLESAVSVNSDSASSARTSTIVEKDAPFSTLANLFLKV